MAYLACALSPELIHQKQLFSDVIIVIFSSLDQSTDSARVRCGATLLPTMWTKWKNKYRQITNFFLKCQIKKLQVRTILIAKAGIFWPSMGQLHQDFCTALSKKCLKYTAYNKNAMKSIICALRLCMLHKLFGEIDPCCYNSLHFDTVYSDPHFWNVLPFNLGCILLVGFIPFQTAFIPPATYSSGTQPGYRGTLWCHPFLKLNFIN